MLRIIRGGRAVGRETEGDVAERKRRREREKEKEREREKKKLWRTARLALVDNGSAPKRRTTEESSRADR